MEIERKFLVEYPDLNTLPFSHKIKISQSYLIKKVPSVERRIRSWQEDDIPTKYYYTEKIFLSATTRHEMESEISKSQYDSFISECDRTIVTVNKVRYTLESNDLIFELDVYPFSNEFATMEVELNDENQPYVPPECVKILREVTGNYEYANIPLCTARKFPIRT